MGTKYHTYTAVVSDGSESFKGFSHKQMLKLAGVGSLLTRSGGVNGPIVMVPKKDAAGQPITLTVTHEHGEFESNEEPQKRGLKPVLPGDMGPYVKVYIAQKQDVKPKDEQPPWMYEGGYLLTELTPGTVLNLTGKAEDEADALEARAKAMRSAAQAYRTADAAKAPVKK